MPRRTDLNHVLVIGSGPIVIGQACEFDYSGTQACRVLRAEGLQVSLVNSNPATIMTDPEYADNTYVEPITAAFVEKVIAQQAERGNKIDAVLATLGGQTALNTAVALYENGVLERYGVELIGADFEAIQRGEDRQRFKDIVAKVGGESAQALGSASRWTRFARPSPSWACRWWCGRPSPWADSARAWRTPPTTSSGWPATGWPHPRRPTCSSRNPSTAGRNSSSS